ncbi:MAG: S4 domain-containing protein YaaA [Chloroherpetonaceae bacterium]|nr:S4 domain-containing protein YaaA [Chthonomonadaceae bacterium]MDW8206327.1 S4 domain-containing protein YaaA [Chloroherpetonaceae bacterium]
MTQHFQLRGEYITLGQLIKAIGLIQTGGEIKAFLASHEVQVNGEREERRGRKLRAGDTVIIPGTGPVQIVEPEH